MKTAFLLLSFLGSFAFAEVSNIDITKSPDGKTVNCITTMDVGRTGYRPLVTTLQPVGSDLKFNTGVASLTCTKKDDRFSFEATRLGIPSRYRDDNGNNVTENFSDLKFLMINSHYDVIAQSDAATEMMQTLEYTVPVASAFTAAEVARLKNGETVHARWEFFLQGLHSVEVNGETLPLGMFTGGSFYINFDLRQNDAGIYEIRNFRLN